MLDAVRDPALRDFARDIASSVTPCLNKDQIPDRVKAQIHDPDPAVRCVSAWFRYSAGHAIEINDLLPILQQALQSPDAWTRRQAARSLGSLGPAAATAIGALNAAARDADQSVRDHAKEAIMKIQAK